MDWSLFLLTVVEMIGMVAFALNGALVGLKYHLDLFGVILVSVTVSLGGGVVRDLIIGRIPPAMFQDYRYLVVDGVPVCGSRGDRGSCYCVV